MDDLPGLTPCPTQTMFPGKQSPARPAVPYRKLRPLLLSLGLTLLLPLAPTRTLADGLFGLVGVPAVDIEGYGWLGDLYLEHTLKVLSTSDERPQPEVNAVFVEDALWIISGELQQQGYLYPSIGVRIRNDSGEVIYEGKWAGRELMPPLPPAIEGEHVLFSIDSGIRFYFESITIEGLPEDFTTQPASYFYPTDQLFIFNSTRFYNRSRAASGLQGILQQLRAMGYRDAEVLEQKTDIDRTSGAARFFAKVQPGPVYYAKEWVIETGSPATAANVLQGIPLLEIPQSQQRITPESLQARIQQIRNRYYEHGYPEVRIVVRYEDATAAPDAQGGFSPATGIADPLALDPTEAVPTVSEALALVVSAPQTDTLTPQAGTSAAQTDTSFTTQPDPAAPVSFSSTGAQAIAVTNTDAAATPVSNDSAIQFSPPAAPHTTSLHEPKTPPTSAIEAATAPVDINTGVDFNTKPNSAALITAEIQAQQQETSASRQSADASTADAITDATVAAQTADADADAQTNAAGEQTQAPDGTDKQAAHAAPFYPANLQTAPPPGTLAPRIPPALLEEDLEPRERFQRVIIQVQGGPQVKIGKIAFSGEYGTNMSVLEDQLMIEPGQELDRNRVEDTRSKLNSLGIFRTVEIEYTEVDENTWDVTYNMQMKQRTEISLIMGVGTFDIIRGGFLIEQNNLWGLAHSQRLRAVQSFKATDVTYRYGIPQIFGNDIDFYAKGNYLYRQEISFNRQEYGAATGFQRYYRPLRTNFDIQYSLEQLSARNRDFITAPGPTEATVSSITLKASHNGLDNPIFPTKGWQARASAEFALKDLGGQVDYQRLELSVAYHTPLNDMGLIFHTGLRHGVITTTGTAQSDIPVNRRFFMGGENTVRGYRRDQAAPRDAAGYQIGAVSYILWQVELEQRLTEDFSLVAFLDALGNAADISQYPFNETLASIGIGINYRTFVGPLRLEYGYNIKKRTGDPDGTLQISLGFPF